MTQDELDLADQFSNGSNVELTATNTKKPPKRGIIYLSTIPPYMNVTRISEVFGQFGTVGRVYLQLSQTEPKNGAQKDSKKTKRKRKTNLFSEGWVEFEQKHIAKKVALVLNSKQVDTRKGSKHFDCIWNIKYLSRFKWTHLHERLAHEKAVRRQKLRTEIHMAKKKSDFFSSNVGKKKNHSVVNKEMQDINMATETIPEEVPSSSRKSNIIGSLFGS